MGTVKVAIVGSSGVGKTALIMQYVQGSFPDGEYIPTTDEIHVVRREFNGKLFELEINDTAGSDEHSRVREIAIGNAEAFVVMYSVSCKDSFLDCRKFIQHIQEIKQIKHIPIILVGNKVDLEGGLNREVSLGDGEALATEFHISFHELTAKDGQLVAGVFNQLMDQVGQKRMSKVKSGSVLHNRKGCCVLV